MHSRTNKTNIKTVWISLTIVAVLFFVFTLHSATSLTRDDQDSEVIKQSRHVSLPKKYTLKHPNNPVMYMDMSIGGKKIGRITFELFSHVTPKTAENWRKTCVGYTKDGKFYGYKGSTFHRIIKNFVTQGGDITEGNGTGGVSIYGHAFEDENFEVKHDAVGLLSMANAGPDTNGSQFSITCVLTPHLDGKHVVFGRVIAGMEEVVRKMENVETNKQNDKPIYDVVVDDCGQIA
ncbi:peptidyl-prolyl cis-trans isomerase [Acrasis kona]|uniref:Peptidyl-prolyl cis-trans isomerase n=1 Tax=Acrasis kona TaxID=1008807 RepID=A0AAW2Z6E7_9EUKA